MKTSIARLGLTAAIAACAVAGQAQAYEAGDIIVRAGVTNVSPEGDSSNINLGGAVQANTGVDVDSDTQLGLTATYMIDSNWGVELLAATPFSHDVKATGALSSVGKIATVKQLPPTLSAIYHFNTDSAITPYIGVGVNYTIFFQEDGKGAFADSKVDLDASFGLAAQVGFDFDLGDNLLLNASVRYIDIDTDATISGGTMPTAKVKVDVDPIVYSVLIGYKF